MSAIFFKDNHLHSTPGYSLLPGGDYLSSDIGRFVDSLAFFETRSDEGRHRIEADGLEGPR